MFYSYKQLSNLTITFHPLSDNDLIMMYVIPMYFIIMMFYNYYLLVFENFICVKINVFELLNLIPNYLQD